MVMPVPTGDRTCGRREVLTTSLPHLPRRTSTGAPDDGTSTMPRTSCRKLAARFGYFRTYTGGNGRAWFLRIVRNASTDWHLGRRRAQTDPFDEEQHSGAGPASDPETLMLRTDDATLVGRAMNHLPDRLRHLLALRELQGLSYRELAEEMCIPMGTVMSGLSRSRQAFRLALDRELQRSGIPKRTHPREQEGNEVLV